MARKRKKKDEAEEKPQQTVKDSDTPEEFSDPTYLVNYVVEAQKESKKASKERRAKWLELWLLYQNKQDYTGKKSWQSKIFTPKIFMHTLRAAALVERAVLQTSTLFSVKIDEEAYEEGEFEAARDKARKVEKKIKAHLEKTTFADSYGEGTVSTFLLGLGAIKRHWGDDDNCQYENTDVMNLYIAPDFIPFVHKKPRYMIEYKVEKLAELLDEVKKNKDVYIEDAVDKLQIDYAQKQEIAIRERTRRGLSAHQRKGEVEKLEFWGDIISKDGKHILRDQLLMVANGNELIRHHENPFADKLPPWRLTVAIPYPHRGIAGTSLVEGAVPLQYTLNNLLNLYMDNLNFTVNKMYEVYKGGLVDQQKARRIYPGKIFLTSTDAKRVVQEVNTTPIGPEVINAIKVVDSEFRQATAITEYVEALPSKHKQTLGEIEKKTAESHGFFDVIARRLERNSIGPLIKDTYNLLVQFSDTLKGLEGKYIFKVGGLTLILVEEKLKANLNIILEGALKSEVLGQMTDIPILWKKMLTHMNLQDAYKEPEEIEGEPGKTPEDAIAKAKEDFRKLPPEGKMRLLHSTQAA